MKRNRRCPLMQDDVFDAIKSAFDQPHYQAGCDGHPAHRSAASPLFPSRESLRLPLIGKTDVAMKRGGLNI